MNARTEIPLTELRIKLTSPYARSIVVEPYGFPMECEYEYDAGEPMVFSPADLAHPGTPPNAELLSCRIGGVEVVDMLKPEQVERIEDAILSELEN